MNDEVFDDVPSNWKGNSGPSEWTWLQSGGQTEYSADQNIQFMLWRDKTTNRGILLWLEPHATWEQRQRQSNQNVTESADVARDHSNE